MSALCVVGFDGSKLKFADLKSLSNEVISNALLNKYAVFFNDSYAEQILEPKSQKHTILISYNFFDRNADELLDVTDFVYESKKNFKINFFNKFAFLNQFFNILFSYQVRDVNIYFTEYGEENLEKYIHVDIRLEEMLEKLYEVFINNSRATGFSFPNINFRFQCN